MTAKTITPDPKPAAKAKAPRLTKAQKDAAIDKVATEIEQSPSSIAAALFSSGQTIAQIALAIEKSHATVRELLTEAGVDFSADKNALDLKDKVKQASAASTERRAKNEADKAKVAELKAKDRAERDSAKRDLVSQVVKRYEATGSVKQTAEQTTNATTGKPYSTTRIMRILTDAGVLTPTKRGDTSERDTRIVEQITSGMEIADVATEHGLSAARVRSIAKKQGLVLEGATRGSKLPEPGTPEWGEFANDVSALCEKWGSALGTMAHAIRRAGSAAGS